ncbi:anaerobic sulfatase maturase [Edwardsiella anguillarum]|uniref:anaerobic sulfatase maturase n=1 Tax=Edwardsiella anguillarum TaxID=1821960 RepID=UPI0005EEED3D|nr:anaerobic sulfatase maturase [Edwardsiella anguillarum]RFT04649.1 anaerobic sulfatase maturase [Edwardsiella anguillarum]BET81781.1 anaerobic sulfatase maturase [Edwardsiella anguillarum]BET85210.1 anaerobic sulfatase maturase [Edwardsiella anguillarum]BET88573.1 anaerobic sulfatase maturase [Edwardsiella anguillarum]BET91864.1 anaerobic sulfatase maturase [Edwardsiella anguillarum]
MNRPFHLMAKPVSYQCNIACDYCFYSAKKGLVKTCKEQRHMDDATLEAYVRQYIEANPMSEIEFTWQGGEPTLAGIEFYKKALMLQQKYAKGKTISNSFQSNGVLIDDEWASFFAQHKFLVGLSIDGPEWLHDQYRKSNSNKSVFNKVIKAMDALQRHRVEVNVLTVVNNITSSHPIEIYKFLTQELKAEFIQFIPAVEQRPDAEKFGELLYPQTLSGGMVTEWSVSGGQYGYFINTIFDYWVRHDVGRVFIQLFDNALAAWAGEQPSLCVMRSSCGKGLVVEQNGDVYSCDHYVYPSHRLGNLHHDNLVQMANGKQQRKFGLAKNQLSAECERCQWRFACQGGCPKHRIHKTSRGWHNHLCPGYKAIFSHIDPYMRFMAYQLNLHLPPANVMHTASAIAATQTTLSKQETECFPHKA